MTGAGVAAALGLDSILTAIGLEAPTVWIATFVGVLAGLLLVAYVAGRRLVVPEGSESNQPEPAGKSGQTGESAPVDESSGSRGIASAIEDARSTTDRTSGDESREGSNRLLGQRGDDLDDDDRLLALLEESDGQLRQSRIVDETDWSKTKVSRTLSQLADEDEVVKIQLGRENLICLPDDVPSIGREREP